jgi:uncharacterized protein
MQPSLSFLFANQTFIAHKNKVLFWPAQQMLILSDLHVGKTAHFRKNGINISSNIFTADMEKLVESILFFTPKEVVIVGDLFHSHSNNEHAIFFNTIQQFANINFKLVSGNHDVYAATNNNNLTNVGAIYQHQQITFIHQPPTAQNQFVISGHIHPRVLLKNKTKQSFNLPCFYFTKQQLLLPAFSAFTGGAVVTPKKNTQIIAVTSNHVVVV